LRKPIRGLGEDKAVYPKDPLCHYTHTKMIAEKAVLAANDGPNGLLTGVIRPNAIYGPRDVLSLVSLVVSLVLSCRVVGRVTAISPDPTIVLLQADRNGLSGRGHAEQQAGLRLCT
jgi:nucleoside-diphosphate-sugar epimerase